MWVGIRATPQNAANHYYVRLERGAELDDGRALDALQRRPTRAEDAASMPMWT